MNTANIAEKPDGVGLSKGDASRLRILQASLPIFAAHGYEGASTRLLADAANVNLGAIQYHFGGKEALYLAAADYIANRISTEISSTLTAANERLDAGETDKDILRELLIDLMDKFATRMIASDDSWAIAKFIFREQMDATDAFDRLYEGAMKSVIGTTRRLLARLRDTSENDRETKIRALTFFGQIIIFATSRGMVLRELGWKSIRKKEIKQIQAVIKDQLQRLIV